MSWDAFTFLLANYWLYLVIALLIGIVTGWVSTSDSGSANQ